MSRDLRIGFVGTRFAGTDGVSLETRKWVRVLEAEGHRCLFFAGESDWPGERSRLVDEADFRHPAIAAVNQELFERNGRSSSTSAAVYRLKTHLKRQFEGFVTDFGIELLIVENALSLPMNVPLGLALTEFLAEHQTPTIAHHHDFYWERRRYLRSGASDYLRMSFPPTLPCIRHVVINSHAAREMALRTGCGVFLIPNVMDFAHPEDVSDDYAGDLRAQLGIDPDADLILQPTRIVPRKRIERAIELVRRLDQKAVLVISHSSGDEGAEYERYLREYAGLLDVKVVFASDRSGYERGRDASGRKRYSLADLYRAADLVSYPSLIEGFGNAFLEAVYYRKPLVMSHYEIYFTDIEPQGFRVIGFDNFIDHRTVRQARNALSDGECVAEIVEHNYAIGRRHYSYEVLRDKLRILAAEAGGR
ncbi:MAG: glycosyltransferase family 4 protein [Pseudomonadota bacterium]|nr:glycosyltransferase family 4 protein [Pseudomonadota bacterium]